MRTIKSVIKKYKSLYPDADVRQNGSWIQINGDSYRTKHVQQMINDYKPTIKPLKDYKIYEHDDETLAKEIYMKADKARHSSSKAEMRKACHDIAKLAKKIMNI